MTQSTSGAEVSGERVTHIQEVIQPLVEHADFNSNNVLPFSPLVAALVDWVKLVIKIALVENDWVCMYSIKCRKREYHDIRKL